MLYKKEEEEQGTWDFNATATRSGWAGGMECKRVSSSRVVKEKEAEL